MPRGLVSGWSLLGLALSLGCSEEGLPPTPPQHAAPQARVCSWGIWLPCT